MKQIVSFFTALIVGLGASFASGGDSAQQLQIAVKRLNAWIGYDENASRWRQLLYLNQLDSEAAKGDRANLTNLRLVHSRFASNLPGLQHPVFSDVRLKLERHIELLSRAERLGILDYLANAEGRFAPITVEQVDWYRNEALYFLQLFKDQYGDRPEADRDEIEFLFEELELDEIIERIRNLELADLLPRDGLSEAEEQQRLSARRRAIRPLVATSETFNRKVINLQDVFFSSAQFSLDTFVRVLINATDRDLNHFVDRQIATLREEYPKLASGSQRMTTARVAAVLGALETTLQHRDLIAAIRRQHSLPNAEIEIHQSLLDGQLGEAQSRLQPVDEVILGRQIYGQSFVTTRPRLELLDDPTQIAASIHLLGNIHSDTYTTQGRITAYAGSNGVFDGRRNLFANVGGFYATDPYVAVNLSSYFKSVDCRLRLVQKVAYKQYLRDKPLSEGIAAARAEIRVQREFKDQLDTALVDGRKRLSSEAPKVNQIRGLIPNVYAYSQGKRIVAVAQKYDSIHMGASRPPQPIHLPADVRVKLHESMVVNFVDPLIVGRTLSNGEIAESIEQATGVRLESLVASDDPEENWSITFPEIQPFQFELENDRIQVGVIGDEFTQGDRTIRAQLLIKFAFRFIRYKGGFYLARDGHVTVEALDKNKLDARGVAFKTFLEKRLNQRNQPAEGKDPLNLEPQEEVPGKTDELQNKIVAAEVGGFPLPENLIPVNMIELPKVAEIARQLKLVELRIKDGWMYLSWKRLSGGQVLTTELSAISKIDSLDQLRPIKNPEPPMPDDNGTRTGNGESP